MGLSLLAIGTLVFGIPSYGDSYKLTIVEQTQDENFYGIDNVGNFVVDVTNASNNPCGGSSCYETFYVQTNTTAFSVTPPHLQYDNGVPCAPNISGFDALGGRCNGNHEIFGGFYQTSPGNEIRGVWTGPDPVQDFLVDGSFDGGYMNYLGDAVFIDGINNTLDWADNLNPTSVPEPGSLLLVGSGTLLLFACLIGRSSEKRRQPHRYQCPT
jgi:hypothetical protein